MEVKEEYHVKISSQFADFENMHDDVINGAWKSIRQSIKASATDSLDYYVLKQHKPWFDEECSKY